MQSSLFYLARKLGILIPTLLGITFLAFLFIHLLPGDPIQLMTGEKNLPPEVYKQYMANFGFDKPLYAQYGLYIERLAHFDLGSSISTRRPVVAEFGELFPATVELSLVAITIALFIGLPAGILSAVYRNKWPDHLIMVTSLVGYSMPIFWWGLLLILFFSSVLGWFPVSGRLAFDYIVPTKTGFYLIDTLLSDQVGSFLDAVHHIILPAVVLATIPLAVIARQTRSVMLEVLGEDYIRTAKAKGLPKWRILFIHALRNAMIPIVTVIGLQVGLLFTGAILTETIFSWPGVGKWMVDSIYRRDYPAVQTGLLFLGVIVMLVNFLVDVTYYILNPRLKSQH